MPDPFVEDLDRGNDKSPSASTKEYVRWQRGPLTRTPMSLMKSWVDTIAAATTSGWCSSFTAWTASAGSPGRAPT